MQARSGHYFCCMTSAYVHTLVLQCAARTSFAHFASMTLLQIEEAYGVHALHVVSTWKQSESNNAT